MRPVASDTKTSMVSNIIEHTLPHAIQTPSHQGPCLPSQAEWEVSKIPKAWMYLRECYRIRHSRRTNAINANGYSSTLSLFRNIERALCAIPTLHLKHLRRMRYRYSKWSPISILPSSERTHRLALPGFQLISSCPLDTT